MEPFVRRTWAIAAAGVWLSVAPLGCNKSEPSKAGATMEPSDGLQKKEADGKAMQAPAATAAPEAPAPAPSALDGDTRGGGGEVARRARGPLKIAPGELDKGGVARGEEGSFGAMNGPVGGKPASPPPPPGMPVTREPSANAQPSTTLVPIDPNGRFATTYRPGGGHLAAFESAVARGIIPAGERELVSDVGARYAPAMDAPKGKAITLRTDFERGKLAPSGGTFHVRVALRSTADKPAERPHLSVHLVLDVSGSMAGESITNARAAASALVDKLAPNDDFSLVTFSNDADVKVPDGPVGARREAIKKIIADIREGGGTNIGRALELGYAQAQTKTIPADAVRVVLLLSDGHANMGITAPDRLSRMALDAFQGGVQTSAFGLGPDYDGALMSAIAAEGAGGYYYLRDAQQITPALSTEIDKRLDPVATAVEVRVRLKKDVSLLRVYGSRRLTSEEAARVRAQEVAADAQAEKRDKIKKDRQDDTEGGMRFFIPAFAPDDSHALLLQLAVPAGAGDKPIAMVEIKYKDRVSKKNVADEFPIKATYADSDAASGASIDASVARTVQGFAAGEALNEAAGKIARGDRPGAIALLTEREQILRQAAQTLNEPLFLKDADRLARLRGHAGTETGMGDPLVLALLLETAGRTHLH
ncbi:MAG: VWA domain-containing protein [Minicystis sp.]